MNETFIFEVIFFTNLTSRTHQLQEITSSDLDNIHSTGSSCSNTHTVVVWF